MPNYLRERRKQRSRRNDQNILEKRQHQLRTAALDRCRLRCTRTDRLGSMKWKDNLMTLKRDRRKEENASPDRNERATQDSPRNRRKQNKREKKLRRERRRYLKRKRQNVSAFKSATERRN